MGVTVIPAYRVVAKFARDVQGLPWEEALDVLEEKLRAYVHHQLSVAQASPLELGVRTALTQLGDPAPEALASTLETLEEGNPRALVEGALARSSEVLSRPDLNARVLLLPGDGGSRVLVQQMHGVMGFSLGSAAMLLFLWPAGDWQRWLVYTAAHEYLHLVRNHLLPRGVAGGRLVYLKTEVPETLLDVIVVEGIADAFARQLYPDLDPPWTHALDPAVEAGTWPKVRRRLSVSDPAEIRRILFGDNDRIPQWTGYTIGNRIVQSYFRAHPGTEAPQLAGTPARNLFDASGYTPDAHTQ